METRVPPPTAYGDQRTVGRNSLTTCARRHQTTEVDFARSALRRSARLYRDAGMRDAKELKSVAVRGDVLDSVESEQARRALLK